MDLPEFLRESPTVLLFSEDLAYLTSSQQRLSETGFRVLNSSNGFETIELSSSGRVDAVVLDLDHNCAEVTLITDEIKRLRPQFPTIVLTEGAAPDALRARADTLIPKGNDEALLASLEKILSASQSSPSMSS